MRGHQKSSPNLRFLKPPSRQAEQELLTSRVEIFRSSRIQQPEISLSTDKPQTTQVFQHHSSRIITLSNLKTQKLLKQNFIQKTEPNETFDRQHTQTIHQIHSCELINIFNRKKTVQQLQYRPITSHQKKYNQDLFQQEQQKMPQYLNNPIQVQDSFSVYYLTDLIKSYEVKENYFSRLFKEHFSASFKALQQCSAGKVIYRPRSITLPRDPKDAKKITILFDLDETLIHCTLDLRQPTEKRITIKLSSQEILQVGLNVRPGLQAMLEQLQPNFEIIVFTASRSQYAKKIIEFIDPKRIISKILSRDNCVFTDLGQYVKDISIIKNRSLAKTILVDNSASSYYYQQDNGVPIVPYYENKLDKQLSSLTKYLNGMIGCDDVRAYNQKYIKTHIMAKVGTSEDALEIYKQHHSNLCSLKQY